MQKISNKSFGGERPLFKSANFYIENIIIQPGESAVKESQNITSVHCEFNGKYPFWYNNNTMISNCIFNEGARAAIWYGKNIEMKDSLVNAPKMFREIELLKVNNVKFPNAQETFWFCKNLNLTNIKAQNADYIFLNNNNVVIDNIELFGNYSFQYCKEVTIKNSIIHSKDAFWNTENVTIYDSIIKGEYLGWNSKNLKLVNCEISGTQPFCYCDNLIMKNCKMDESCDLCFEYSTLDVEIHSKIKSIKNPTSGSIKVNDCNEIIIDKNVRELNKCLINFWNDTT